MNLVEQQHQTGLAVLRAQEREAKELDQTASKIKPPAKGKYHRRFLLAAVLDALDWLELTGVGLIITYALKFIFAPVLFMYGFSASSRVKTMNTIAQSLQEQISHLTKRAYTYANRYRTAVKFATKHNIAPRTTQRVVGAVGKAGQLITRNPVIKNTLANLADFVPLLDLFPWRTLGVWLTYRDELKTYQESLPVVEEYRQAKAQEVMAEYAA